MVKECKAFYLDSLKNRAKRDYTVLSQILDDALFEHSMKGGIVPRRGKGRVHFKHYTDVSCTQQHDGVSRTKVAATQLIKHAGSPNEVSRMVISTYQAASGAGHGARNHERT